jgi:hypothetical protein
MCRFTINFDRFNYIRSYLFMDWPEWIYFFLKKPNSQFLGYNSYVRNI